MRGSRRVRRWPTGKHARRFAIATIALGLLSVGCAMATTTGWGPAVTVSPPADAAAGGDASTELTAVACPEAGDCTALGDYQGTGSRMLAMSATSSGSQWGAATALPLPSSPFTPDLQAVSCSDAGDCVAVGTYEAGLHALLLTETDGVWSSNQPIRLPAGAVTDGDTQLNGVACPQVGFCTVVGIYTIADGSTLMMAISERNGQWLAPQKLAGPTGPTHEAIDADLNGLACPKVGYCTAAGDYVNSRYGTTLPMVISEHAGRWGTAQAMRLPSGGTSTGSDGNTAQLNGVACPSTGYCTAVGFYSTSDDQASMIISERAGRWGTPQELRLPRGGSFSTLNDVACAGVGDCTAVGDYTDRDNHEIAAVVGEANGRWLTAQPIQLPTGPLSADASPELKSVACPSTGGCTAVGDDGEAIAVSQPG